MHFIFPNFYVLSLHASHPGGTRLPMARAGKSGAGPRALRSAYGSGWENRPTSSAKFAVKFGVGKFRGPQIS